VEVDEARDSMSEDMHESIAPSALAHLEGELWRGQRDLLPADLANDLVRLVSGTLLEQPVTPHLGARASEARTTPLGRAQRRARPRGYQPDGVQ
jgi:hypothetical protein